MNKIIEALKRLLLVLVVFVQNEPARAIGTLRLVLTLAVGAGVLTVDDEAAVLGMLGVVCAFYFGDVRWLRNKVWTQKSVDELVAKTAANAYHDGRRAPLHAVQDPVPDADDTQPIPSPDHRLL